MQAVYTYPPEALHITLATFWSIHRTEQRGITDVQRKALTYHVQNVLEFSWEKYIESFTDENHFELEFESAQIGHKAGILLWNERTGRLDIFRDILREACQENARTYRVGMIPNRHLCDNACLKSEFPI